MPENKVLSSALAKEPSLKKYMKKAMPFAQLLKVSVLLCCLFRGCAV